MRHNKAEIIKKICIFILASKYDHMMYMHVRDKRYRNFVFISRLIGKIKKTYAVLVYGHVIILRSQNKNTDFVIILA